MNGEENLFGPGPPQNKSDEQSDLFDFNDSSDAVQASNPDDFFVALTSDRSSGSKEDEFDPFADLWSDVGSTGKSTLAPSITAVSTSAAITTTVTQSPEMTDSGSKSDNTSKDTFGDLLDFDPLGSVSVDASTAKTAEKVQEAAHLFDDLDPLFEEFRRPASNKRNPFEDDVPDDLFSPRSNLSKDDNDPLGSADVKTDNPIDQTTTSHAFAVEDDLFGFSLSFGNQESVDNDDKTQPNIFESMKTDSFDPFASDPFLVEKTESVPRKQEALERGLTSELLPDILDPLRDTKVDCKENIPEIVMTTTKDESMTPTITVAVEMRRPKENKDVLETEYQTIDDTVDLSAIEGTEHLDIDANKQKTSLRKKGALGLRRKPSRKGVRTALLAATDKYQDNADPKPAPDPEEDGINGINSDVHEKHDEEKPETMDKPSPAERPTVLPRQCSGRTPPNGQMLLPGLGEISKVKLRSRPVKPLSRIVSSETSNTSAILVTPQVRTPQQRTSMLTSPVQLRTSPLQSRTSPVQPRPASIGSPLSRPSLRPKPNLTEKPKFASKNVDSSAKKECSLQPLWLREPKQAKLETGADGLSTKLQQEQEPEKPAWMKAAMEKRKRASELLEKDRPNNNKENSLPPSWSRQSPLFPETKDQSETRLNRINDLHTHKSSTSRHASNASASENLIQNNLTNSPGDRASSDISVMRSQDSLKESLFLKMDSNGHQSDSLFGGSSPQKDVNDEVVLRRPKVTSKPAGAEYVPSWSSPGNISEEGQTPGLDMPKWKRDLLEKNRQKRESGHFSPQTPQNKETAHEDLTPSWQRELQKKRQSFIKKDAVLSEPKQPVQPEWMRKAAERRARFSKSGLGDKK